MTAPGPTEPTAQVLAGGRVVTPAGVRADAWIEVRSGRIRQVGRGSPPSATVVSDLEGAWVLPGYIDLHMHGGGGHSVTTSPEAMRGAVNFHLQHGTTATLISLMTDAESALLKQLRWVAELVRETRGRVLGTHLEGPFLAASRCGAQNPAHLLMPDETLAERLLGAAAGTLRVLTIAPELPGALTLIQRLHAAGVTVALGHSDAGFEQALAAFDAGAGHVTHLFNAMAPMHHRRPGLAGAALASTASCELINDGVHLHPAVVAMVFSTCAAPVLVTDAIAAAGVGDGSFSLGGLDVQVIGGEARLAGGQTLAGSTLTMDRALRDAVQRSGVSIERAAAAASTTPARVLGLDRELGSIAAGRRADLVVLDDDLLVRRVMLGGRWSTAAALEES